jgi:hypothetical protein
MRENDLTLEDIVFSILASVVLLMFVWSAHSPDKTAESLRSEFIKVCAEANGVLVHTPEGGLKCLRWSI